LSPLKPLGPIAFEPAEHGGLTLADNAGHLWDLEPWFCREPNHRRPRPQPRNLGRAGESIELCMGRGGHRWSLERSHTTSITPGVETFVAVLSEQQRLVHRLVCIQPEMEYPWTDRQFGPKDICLKINLGLVRQHCTLCRSILIVPLAPRGRKAFAYHCHPSNLMVRGARGTDEVLLASAIEVAIGIEG
jgi:hypothetical protein